MTDSIKKKKTYNSFSSLLEMNAGECAAAIATAAPTIERFIKKSGIVSFMVKSFNNAEDEEAAEELAAEALTILLKHALGDCLDEMLEIIAIINFITVDELKERYSGLDLVLMVKTVITDKGFFSLLGTFSD